MKTLLGQEERVEKVEAHADILFFGPARPR